MKLLLICILLLGSMDTWAGVPAARLTDLTSAGGTVQSGSSNVLIGGLPASRVGDIATCLVFVGPTPVLTPGPIVTGSSTVFVNGAPAARLNSVVGTSTPCTIVTGSGTVNVSN